MQDGSQLVAVMLVLNQGVSLEHGAERVAAVMGLVAELCEELEVACDLPLVPRGHDRLDIREVLVERRATDAGLLGDLGHRHGTEPAAIDEASSRIEDRVPDRATVRVDRLVPSWTLA
jgi:hypothetical protein